MKEIVTKFNLLKQKQFENEDAEINEQKIPHKNLKKEWKKFFEEYFPNHNEDLKLIEDEISLMQELIDLGRENNEYTLDQLKRLKEIYPKIKNGGMIGTMVTEQMFQLHNELFPKNAQKNKSCGYCVKKVWERIIVTYKLNFE